MIESILLAATPVRTLSNNQPMTNASGFFYRDGERLFLVTSRHVLIDDEIEHFPDAISITLHTDPDNMAAASSIQLPLYRDGLARWRQGRDAAGAVDIAVLEIDADALPPEACFTAFEAKHLLQPDADIEIGSTMLVVGFPLGFHDALHHLPVVRHAINASSFAMRFQGNGYFLTDSRTHRGTSGAAVVMRNRNASGDPLPWFLLGVHSSRIDMLSREADIDEALGLNCVWFADMLPTLTAAENKAAKNRIKPRA